MMLALHRSLASMAWFSILHISPCLALVRESARFEASNVALFAGLWQACSCISPLVRPGWGLLSPQSLCCIACLQMLERPCTYSRLLQSLCLILSQPRASTHCRQESEPDKRCLVRVASLFPLTVYTANLYSDKLSRSAIRSFSLGCLCS